MKAPTKPQQNRKQNFQQWRDWHSVTLLTHTNCKCSTAFHSIHPGCTSPCCCMPCYCCILLTNTVNPINPTTHHAGPTPPHHLHDYCAAACRHFALPVIAPCFAGSRQHNLIIIMMIHIHIIIIPIIVIIILIRLPTKPYQQRHRFRAPIEAAGSAAQPARGQHPTTPCTLARTAPPLHTTSYMITALRHAAALHHLSLSCAFLFPGSQCAGDQAAESLPAAVHITISAPAAPAAAISSAACQQHLPGRPAGLLMQCQARRPSVQ